MRFRAKITVVVGTLILGAVFFYFCGDQRQNEDTRELASTREYGKPENNALEVYANKYLKYVPDKRLKKTIRDYAGEVAQIHSGANESIEVSNQKYLNSNPCFSELASEFYLGLFKEDLRSFKQRVQLTERPLGVRVALDEEAGQGVWKDKKPGFLWSELMNITGNDPNFAVQIVRMCGHDDAINERPYLSSAHPAFKKIKSQKIKEFEEFLQSWPQAPEYLAEMLQEMKSNNKVEFGCWSSSALYLPKSLGEEVSISEELKKKISRIQAPTLGLKAIPAKNYHVLAGLFTGCRFKSETGYSFIGSNLARIGARFYRAKTLDAKIGSLQSPVSYDAWDKIDESLKTASFVESLREKRLKREGPLVALLNPLPDSDVKEMSIEEIRQHASRYVARVDAASLWRKWYEKVRLPGIGEVYLPNKSRRPEFASDSLGAPILNKSKNLCGEKWTPERCRQALSTMDTWEVDFEWSQEAQYRGGRAGEKLCQFEESSENLEKRACAIIETRKKSAVLEPSESSKQKIFSDKPKIGVQ